MRLAYFSPLPPSSCDAANLSAMLLPALAARANITAFVASDAPEARGLDPKIACRPAPDFVPADHDIAVYQMGNSIHHSCVYRRVLENPGITVLNEPFLHAFVARVTLGQGDAAGYVREMGYAYGPTGAALARSICAGRLRHPVDGLPLLERCVDASLGIIVHSRYARRVVESSRPDVPIAVIQQPVATCQVVPADPESLGIRPSAILVGVVGQITRERQVPAILRAFAQLRAQRPEAHLLIIGEVPPWLWLIDEAIRDLELETSVSRTGHMPRLDDAKRWIAATDLCIDLQVPTLGETSARLLCILALGKPALACDVGWYSELPRDVCRHIPRTSTGEIDEDALTAGLLEMANDPAGRRAMGECARAYVAEHHRLDDSVKGYLDFIGSIVSTRHCA